VPAYTARVVDNKCLQAANYSDTFKLGASLTVDDRFCCSSMRTPSLSEQPIYMKYFRYIAGDAAHHIPLGVYFHSRF